jgi:hypothetical protein
MVWSLNFKLPARREGASCPSAGGMPVSTFSCDSFPQAGGLVARTAAGLQDTKNPLVREGSLRFIRSLCEVVGFAAEPYVVPMLPQVRSCRR